MRDMLIATLGLKPENEHVEVHELRGFSSENLLGALNEARAVSRGTCCMQYLFSRRPRKTSL